MATRVVLEHRTTYRFDRRTTLHPHSIRLRPAPHTRTPILGYSLRVEPGRHFLNWQQDPFGNHEARLVFEEPADELDVLVEVIADLAPINPFDFFLEPSAERIPFRYDDQLAHDLGPYLAAVPGQGSRFDEFVRSVDPGEMGTMDYLVAVNQQVLAAVDYTVRLEPGVQTADETLDRRAGSCRDSAWLLVQVLRRLGLAARFVSGYLVQLVADIPPAHGPSGPDEDFTDLHAWVEVFLPGAGWVGLDPTSGLLAGEGHIPLAATPGPGSAAPISGATSPCEVAFSFSNVVRRVDDRPRPTLPYRDDEWRTILELGHRVDAQLAAGDVRLTMGGEPTFVSTDDPDAPEWTTEADGEHKQDVAETLTHRLRDRLAPGSLLHAGQGKWYPGEPLPRWSRRLVWRTDGVRLWSHDDLLAPHAVAEHGASEQDAIRFIRAIAEHIGASPERVLVAHEDPIYHLWHEATLPVDVDAEDLDLDRVDLDDAGHRAALAKVLDRGLGRPAGAVLPLGWALTDDEPERWVVSRWRFRRDQLFLAPGTSPIGHRLPLDRLEATTERAESPVAPDPFDPSGGSTPGAVGDPPMLAARSSAVVVAETDELVTSAITAEARDGVLHVFLPPVSDAGAWIDLVGVVEAIAVELEQPVRVEGYPAPDDELLQTMAVTPDPGVIEVNVMPVSTWADAVELTETIYTETAACNLSAERFDLDGRHTGTGGGNHITIGGPTPADSPILRRPDLLRSLVTYWQHHPGLSYLFSGAFIGPTSQAPRVDEARHDTLDELEVAFSELAALGDHPLPWIVDRLFRNLLVDLTGNTHRAEFCIDKLFPGENADARRGLVEMRGFEMTPHPRMNLVQQLLLRCLIARFWNDPYEGRLVRWGTELHDRFMLPHHVSADLADVCADLADHGLPFRPEWLAPFVEFRFPVIGEVEVGEVQLTLRQALEPWSVLGEEMSDQGTSRSVDSSMERLEVSVSGVADGRHTVTVNGHALELHRVGKGQLVGGVRYRAWLPPHALHPTIPVQSPLVFDVVDTWHQRAIGGCTYHVVHPGGRSYDRRPVNTNEAAGRRVSRFWEFGHSPQATLETTSGERVTTFSAAGSPVGPLDRPVEAADTGGFTLDLRHMRRRNGSG